MEHRVGVEPTCEFSLWLFCRELPGRPTHDAFKFLIVKWQSLRESNPRNPGQSRLQYHCAKGLWLRRWDSNPR